jgi:hypothetical protein
MSGWMEHSSRVEVGEDSAGVTDAADGTITGLGTYY